MENKYIQVGQLARSFGTEGALKIKLFEEFLEVSTKEVFLFINHDEYFVPYRVIKLNLSKKMVAFSDINTQQKADRIGGERLFLEEDKVKHLVQNGLSEFIDMIIYDEENLVGPITDIRELPNQLLATVKYQDREIYIPLHEDLIDEMDPEAGIIRMNLPDGLLDL